MIVCIQSEDLSVPYQTPWVQVKEPSQFLSLQTTFCAVLCGHPHCFVESELPGSCHITLCSIPVNECSLQPPNLSLELLHLLPAIQRSPVVRLQARYQSILCLLNPSILLRNTLPRLQLFPQFLQISGYHSTVWPTRLRRVLRCLCWFA